MAYTPMMEQYFSIKEQYKDCILFYRVGDFYELYFDDAIVGSKVLELVLTKKSCGSENKAAMCGVPYHAVESYLAKMVDHGYKVAIAEQMTDPALTKGLVEREVIRVITPGTVVQSSMLSEKDNNYLASVYIDGFDACVSYCDISTGEFKSLQICSDIKRSILLEELTRIQPKEILTNVNKELCPELYTFSKEMNTYISESKDKYYEKNTCNNAINSHNNYYVNKISLDKDNNLMFFAVGALLSYLKDTQKQEVEHLGTLEIIDIGNCMLLDRATIRNLEITENLQRITF